MCRLSSNDLVGRCKNCRFRENRLAYTYGPPDDTDYRRQFNTVVGCANRDYQVRHRIGFIWKWMDLALGKLGKDAYLPILGR